MNLEKAARLVDVRGQICPYPLIEIKQGMKNLAEGQVLEIVTDYEAAVMTTIPAFCEKTGYLYELNQAGNKTWRVLIVKSTRLQKKESIQCKC